MTLKVTLIILVTTWLLINSHKIESNFYGEEPCQAKGGYCVLEKECPGTLTDEFKHLCAAQSSSGAVCCKNIKQSDVNCYQLHNTCMERCPESLTLGKKGCLGTSVCCVLV